MTWSEIALLIACGILVILPPKYDPAIRWKEFNIRWTERIRKQKEQRNAKNG